jgi:hypothetical protein
MDLLSLLPLARRVLLPLTVAGAFAVGLFGSEKDASAQLRRGYGPVSHHAVAGPRIGGSYYGGHGAYGGPRVWHHPWRTPAGYRHYR